MWIKEVHIMHCTKFPCFLRKMCGSRLEESRNKFWPRERGFRTTVEWGTVEKYRARPHSKERAVVQERRRRRFTVWTMKQTEGKQTEGQDENLRDERRTNDREEEERKMFWNVETKERRKMEEYSMPEWGTNARSSWSLKYDKKGGRGWNGGRKENRSILLREKKQVGNEPWKCRVGAIEKQRR